MGSLYMNMYQLFWSDPSDWREGQREGGKERERARERANSEREREERD